MSVRLSSYLVFRHAQEKKLASVDGSARGLNRFDTFAFPLFSEDRVLTATTANVRRGIGSQRCGRLYDDPIPLECSDTSSDAIFAKVFSQAPAMQANNLKMLLHYRAL